MHIDNDLASQFKYLGFEKILPFVVCVDENSVFAGGQVIDFGIDIIASVIKQKKLPIINLSGNPLLIDHCLSKFGQHFAPEQFFVLSPDYSKDYNLYQNTALWPATLLWQQRGNTFYYKNFKKKYRISSLSRQVRRHRLELLQAIKPFVTNNDVVVANTVIDNNVPYEIRNCQEALEWVKELPWYNNKDFFDLESCPPEKFNYTSVDHPAYFARVNVTNESWCNNDLLFISEKTWKAYACGCLVVNYGTACMPTQLEKFGFEIWKEFDPAINYQEKISKIVELFQRNDIDDLYDKKIDMIAHNQRLVTSWHFARQLAVPAAEKIQSLL